MSYYNVIHMLYINIYVIEYVINHGTPTKQVVIYMRLVLQVQNNAIYPVI